MNWADWVFLALGVWFVGKGFKTGLPKESFVCLRMGLVLWFSLSYLLFVSRLIHQNSMISPEVSKLIAYLGVAFLIFMSVTLVGRILAKIVQFEFVPFLEGLGILVIGLIHTWLFIAFALFLLIQLPTSFFQGAFIQESFIGQKTTHLLLKAYPHISQSLGTVPKKSLAPERVTSSPSPKS